MARLRVLRDGVELQSVDLARLGKPSLVVGRAPESDIKLDDRAVGREHAVFLINSKGIVVQKKSKFGKMSVNGAELAESALKPGDVISIADYLVRVEEESAAASAPALESDDMPPLGDAPAGVTAPDASAAPAGTASEEGPDLHAVSDGPTSALNLNAATNEPEASAPAIEPPAESTGGEVSLGLATENPGESTEGQPDNGGMFVESERTAMIPQAKITTKLVFKPGDANIDEFSMTKSEVSIGRGSNCDIVISDKKSSRKHLIIKKVGMNFVAKDLGSANGTYVNGVKISEQELAGDDVLRIGETEFVFKATSQDYFEQEQEFAQVQEQPMPQDQGGVDPNMAMAPVDANGVPMLDPNAQPMDADPNAAAGAVTGGIPGLGTGGDAPKKKETLLDKFKRQPPLRKIIIVGAILGLYMFLDQEPPKQVKKPVAKVEKGDASFEALPQEKKQFVINTYQLAFDLYKNKDYERAIYEVDKLLQVLPGGYKDAKDIKSFAQKSIDILKAQEEEKRRKEAEEKLRKEVADLVAKAEELVLAGKYDDAKIVFGQVLERDPENPVVMRLRQQIEEREAKKRAEEEAAKEKEMKRKLLESTIREAREMLAGGRYYDVIAKLADAPVIFAEDERLLNQAKQLIVDAKRALKERAEPFLADAKKKMSDEDYQGARESYLKALKIDYKNDEAKRGIDKIKEILHTRSKKVYTEAILLESVSDYKAAIEKFKQCLSQAVPGDIYHGRCSRKVKRYEMLDRSPAEGGGSAPSTDPKMPELPQQLETTIDGGN